MFRRLLYGGLFGCFVGEMIVPDHFTQVGMFHYIVVYAVFGMIAGVVVATLKRVAVLPDGKKPEPPSDL